MTQTTRLKPGTKVWVRAEINEVGVRPGQKTVGVLVRESEHTSYSASVPVSALELRE